MTDRMTRKYDDAYLDQVAARVLEQFPGKEKPRTIAEAIKTPQIENVVKALIDRGYTSKKEVAQALVQCGMDKGKWEIEKLIAPFFKKKTSTAPVRGTRAQHENEPEKTKPAPRGGRGNRPTPLPVPSSDGKAADQQGTHGGLRTNV